MGPDALGFFALCAILGVTGALLLVLRRLWANLGLFAVRGRWLPAAALSLGGLLLLCATGVLALALSLVLGAWRGWFPV